MKKGNRSADNGQAPQYAHVLQGDGGLANGEVESMRLGTPSLHQCCDQGMVQPRRPRLVGADESNCLQPLLNLGVLRPGETGLVRPLHFERPVHVFIQHQHPMMRIMDEQRWVLRSQTWLCHLDDLLQI